MNEKTSEEDLIYARSRAAHMLTGINYAIDSLERERTALIAVLNGEKRLGRPPKVLIDENAIPAIVASASRGSGIKEWWSKKTPEERTAEMQRRLDVRHAKKAAAAQGVKFEPKEFKVEIPIEPEPVKKEHPRKGKKSKWWLSLTRAQRDAHVAKARKAMMKKLGYGKKKQLVNGHAKTEAQAAA